jgi:hypothetical protein
MLGGNVLKILQSQITPFYYFPGFTNVRSMVAAANMAQYLSQSQGAPLKAHSGNLVDRTSLYWPGLQGLVANPMAWRDRLGSSEYFNNSKTFFYQHMDKTKFYVIFILYF